MPKCVVKSCPHATGQKSAFPNITLHGFPRSVPQIQAWLQLAGMDGEILRDFTKMVMEDRHSDKFRMCSAHFTEDCYLMKGVRRVLKGGSMPTIFPKDSPIFDATLDPWLRRNNRRARTEDPSTNSTGDPPLWLRRCCCSCHRQAPPPPPPRGNMVDASTQTDGSCFVFVLSGIPYTKAASHKTISMDHDYDKSEESQPSKGQRSTANPTAPPPMFSIANPKDPPGKDVQQEERSRESRNCHTSTSDENGLNYLVPKSFPKKEEDFLLVHIKEESLSEEDTFPNSDNSTPKHDTPSPSVKEESILYEEPHPFEMDYSAVIIEEDFKDPPCSDLTTPKHCTPPPFTHIKEEPFSGEEHLVQPYLSSPTCGTQPTSVLVKEEPEQLSDSNIASTKTCTQLPSVGVKEEPIMDAHVPSADLSKKTQPRSVSREGSLKLMGQSQRTLKKSVAINDALQKNFSRHKGASSKSTSRPSTEIIVTVNNCSMCEESFTSPQELSQHYWMHHAKLSGIKDRLELSCLQCDVRFERMEEMRAHWRIHPLTCQYCGKSYKSLYYLSKHEVMHKVNPCSCHDCERCLVSPPFLQIPQETHAAEDIFDGSAHDQCVLTNSELIRHHKASRLITCESRDPDLEHDQCFLVDSEPIRLHQVHKALRLITCESRDPDPEHEQCLLADSKPIQHHQVHKASKLPTCESQNPERVLEREQTSSNDSNSTLPQGHMTFKSVICFKCGKCFVDQHKLPEDELQADQKVHSCPRCAKQCSSYGLITRRRWVCRGRKDAKCRECRRNFVSRERLLIHRAIVHQKCPFSCAECGRCFKNKLRLMAHKKIRHDFHQEDPKLSRRSRSSRRTPT